MSKVLVITNREQYIAFKETHRRGIIFYSADWCSACKEIEPLYTRIANRYHDRITMAYVDIDVCELEFSSVPVFVSYYEGTQLNSLEGADDDGLKLLVKEAIEHNHHPKNPSTESLLMTDIDHPIHLAEPVEAIHSVHTVQPIQSAQPIQFNKPIQLTQFTEPVISTTTNPRRPIIVRIPPPEQLIAPSSSTLIQMAKSPKTHKDAKIRSDKTQGDKTQGPKIQNEQIRGDILKNIKNTKNTKKSKSGAKGYIEVIT